jgi:hypothetical protein
LGDGTSTPSFAHNVSCAIAVVVVKGCFAHNCFGQFSLPYNGVGEPSFPQPPRFKPVGFECYQIAASSYTAGIPLPDAVETPTGEGHVILCHRDVNVGGPNLVIVQQLVAYDL